MQLRVVLLLTTFTEQWHWVGVELKYVLVNAVLYVLKNKKLIILSTISYYTDQGTLTNLFNFKHDMIK